MSTQRYGVTPQPIETLLTWVNSGEIANPAIDKDPAWLRDVAAVVHPEWLRSSAV